MKSTSFLYHSAYNAPIDMGTQFDTSGQDILYKSNLRTPYLILYVKVQKLYHFYTVPTSYLYRFFDFYITSISLKFSVITDAISYLYHFPISTSLPYRDGRVLYQSYIAVISQRIITTKQNSLKK